MNSSLKRIKVLTGRNFKEIMRDPLSIIFTLGLPLLLEVLFYLIFHSLTSQFEMRYLAPGIVVFSQSFLALFVGMLLTIDRSSSFLTRLFVSKAKPHEFILAYAFAILPLVLVQSILFFLIGGIFDASIFSINMIFAILLSLVTSIFFIVMGLFLGVVCNEKSIGGISSIIIAGQSVLSGMWFPTEGLSGGMIKLMNVLPFRNGTLLIQNTLNGIQNYWNDFTKPLIIVFIYSVIMLIITIVIFRHKMKEN